jgi:hypothetical protein
MTKAGRTDALTADRENKAFFCFFEVIIELSYALAPVVFPAGHAER